MPDTPNFSITYPCQDEAINSDHFRDFATDVEAAVSAVNVEAAAVLNTPYARIVVATANPAAAAETTMTFGVIPAGDIVNGITVNSGAGTMTIVTPGVYHASVQVSGNQATLTMTSQRISVFVNGVFLLTRKFRGFNPANAG